MKREELEVGDFGKKEPFPEEKEISTPPPTPPPAFPQPTCPWCGDDPLKVAGMPSKMGPMTVMTFFCGRCRKVLAMNVIDVEQPRIVSPEGGSRLVS